MSLEKNNQKILLLIDKNERLELSEIDQFKQLLFDCDINISGNQRETPLMFLLSYNKSYNINIDNQTIFKLLKKSNLNQQDSSGCYLAYYLIFYNKCEFKLSQNKIMYLLKKADLNIK